MRAGPDSEAIGISYSTGGCAPLGCGTDRLGIRVIVKVDEDGTVITATEVGTSQINTTNSLAASRQPEDWTSQKSFRRKDGKSNPPGAGGVSIFTGRNGRTKRMNRRAIPMHDYSGSPEAVGRS